MRKILIGDNLENKGLSMRRWKPMEKFSND